MISRAFGIALAVALLSGCGSNGRGPVAASPSPPLVFSTPLPPSCLDGGSIPEKPLIPDAAQKRDYRATYRQPAVVGLKNILASYAAGGGDADARRVLAPYGATFARDGFVVLSIDKGLMGGSIMTLRFTRHADRIFKAWVYTTSAGTPSLRALDGTECSPDEQKWMAMRYAQLFALGDDRTLVGR